MEFTPDQVEALIGGGDNPLHYHTFDRVPTNATLKGLTGVALVSNVSGNATLTGEADYVVVDTRAGTVTLTLPTASKGFEFEILKPYAANTLIVAPQSTDTILTQVNPVTIRTAGAALRFKSFGNDWKLI